MTAGRLACMAVAAAAALGVVRPSAAAQAVDADTLEPPVMRTAVLGDSARVGDVVPVAIRIVVEPGKRVAWPDTLPLASEDLENAASVRVEVDTLADGRLQLTGIYAVTPWRTGALPLPDVAVPVQGRNDTARAAVATLPGLDVASVLPADTAGIQPRPAKEVLGPNWAWQTLLLAALVALVAVGLLAWWIRRRARRGAGAAVVPDMTPRERALDRLREAREAGLLDAGDAKAFYTRITQAVREYAAALNPVWGEDLTTTELLSRVRAEVGPAAAAALAGVLRPADRVKFAQRRPDRPTAEAEWESARQWVEGFDWPPAATPVDGEAA